MEIFTGKSDNSTFKSEEAAELDTAVNREEVDLDEVKEVLSKIPLPQIYTSRPDFSDEELKAMGISV